jgi:hypothetical protein
MGVRTFIMSPDPRFPVGTNVSVYRRSDFPTVPPIPSGAPGGAVAVAGPVAVGADGRATFTGLNDLTEYLVYAATPDRWTRFRTGLSVPDQQAAAANLISGEISPADRLLLAWTFDPVAARDSASPTSGQINGTRLKHPGGLVTGIVFVDLNPLVGGVAGNFVGLYDVNGNRLAQSADQSGAWAAGSGLIATPLSAPIFLPAQQLDVVFLSNMNAGLTPALARVAGATAVPSAGGAGAPMRSFTADSGVTALPAALGVKTARDNINFFGIY